MMKYLPILLLVFSSTIVYSQKVVASLTELNVIYIGLENEIEIAVEGYKEKDLVKKTINAQLYRKNGKQYIISEKRGEAQLIVGVLKNADTLWLDTVEYRVRSLPRLEPQMGTLQDGAIQSLGAIRANANRLYLSYGEGFIVRGLKGGITAFTCTIIDSLGLDSWRVKGSSTTSEIRNRIWRTSAYGKIIFSDFEYFVTAGKDTIVSPRKLENRQVVITFRPTYRQNFFDSYQETQKNNYPAYTIKGRFKEDLDSFYFSSLYHFENYFSQYKAKTKVGVWQYYSGLGNEQYMYLEEHYDTLGNVFSYKQFDKNGFNTLNIEFKNNIDSAYYIERYSNGNTKKEGWVYISGKDYIHLGEITKSYHGTLSRNLYRESYEKMKFIPFGNWKEFHKNGKLKLSASFKTIVDYDYEIYGVNIDTYFGSTVFSEGINTVVDGLWIEYDENGKEINKWLYDKGYWKEE